MTGDKWAIELEVQSQHGYSTGNQREIRDAKLADAITNFDYAMHVTNKLHWDEKIDDAQFEQRKAQHRTARDQRLADILAWYDWVKDGRPE